MSQGKMNIHFGKMDVHAMMRIIPSADQAPQGQNETPQSPKEAHFEVSKISPTNYLYISKLENGSSKPQAELSTGDQ